MYVPAWLSVKTEKTEIECAVLISFETNYFADDFFKACSIMQVLNCRRVIRRTGKLIYLISGIVISNKKYIFNIFLIILNAIEKYNAFIFILAFTLATKYE